MRYFVFFAFFVVLFACNMTETEPKIILGREWNSNAGVVADTTSQFKLSDKIIIQIDNGKPFSASKVELRVYQDSNDNTPLFKHTTSVKGDEAKLTIGVAKPPTVRNILRTTTPGIYRITFTAGDSLLAEKKMELIK